MSLEIERKFLLKSMPAEFKKKSDVAYQIDQFYFKNTKTGIFERIRVAKNIKKNSDVTYFHTVKVKIADGVNEETERIIDKKEAISLVRKQKNNLTWVSKIRYIKKRSKEKWELDTFISVGIIMLEVEIQKRNQKIVLPKELKEELIMEVTHLKEFSNRNLSRKVSYKYFLSKI